MYSKIQKTVLIFIFTIVLLFLIMFGACTPFKRIKNAQAQTFEQHIPSFGLFCKDKEMILSGAVKYDLSDAKTIAQRKGTMQSNYQLTAVNHTVEFSIPFISSAEQTPSFSVTANGQKVNGSIYYGDIFSSEKDTDFETLIDKTYSPIINENINGTLYTITSDNETITIELSFIKGKNHCFIYETSNNLTSSVTADGTNTWVFNNAYTNTEYKFFIIGENSDFAFSCNNNYQTETMTCKEFIERQYQSLKEIYDEYGVDIDFFYSMFNKLLQSEQSIRYDDLFFHSMSTQRLNIYKFSLYIDTDVTISYELPINIQGNSAFTPMIYLVEQKNLGNYPIRHTVELNNQTPYIIETSVQTEKNGISYNAETTEDYYFVFCSSEKPESTIFPNNRSNNTTLIICCYTIGGIAFAVLIVLMGIAIYQKAKHR